MRLFLDANVLFTAAHNPNGKAALVLELATVGLWQAVTSAYALEEARRNLERKCPGFWVSDECPRQDRGDVHSNGCRFSGSPVAVDAAKLALTLAAR